MKRPSVGAAVFIFFLSLVIFSGCDSLGTPKHSIVLIGGSDSMESFCQSLADEFMKLDRKVKIIYGEGGSTAGVLAVEKNAIDIGLSSRELNPNEGNRDTKEYLVGLNALAIVVHPSNPKKDVSREELREIYLGKTDRWKNGNLIHVVTYRQDTPVMKELNGMILHGESVRADATVVGSTEKMLEKVAADASAIGYVRINHVTDSVKTLSVENVLPDRFTVHSGRYPLIRPLYFITTRNTPQAALDFLFYALGEEGQKVLEREGLFSVR